MVPASPHSRASRRRAGAAALAASLGLLAPLAAWAAAVEPERLAERHLAGAISVHRFAVSAGERIVADDDIAVYSERDIVIDGPITALPRADRSDLSRGVSIQLRTPGTIFVNATLAAGPGRHGTARCTAGERGGDVVLHARRIIFRMGSLRGAAGGDGGPDAPGGRGGDLVLDAAQVVSTFDGGEALRLYGGAGGKGGDGTWIGCGESVVTGAGAPGGAGGDVRAPQVTIARSTVGQPAPPDVCAPDGAAGSQPATATGGTGGTGGAGSQGTMENPDGGPGGAGGPGGLGLGSNGGGGGNGGDCCVPAPGQGGKGGPGGKGALGVGGTGGAGGPGGAAWFSAGVYQGTGGVGGDGGNGGPGKGGNGGPGGNGGKGSPAGAGGAGGALGGAAGGSGGAAGSGGAGAPAGKPGTAGTGGATQGAGNAGAAGLPGGSCSGNPPPTNLQPLDPNYNK